MADDKDMLGQFAEFLKAKQEAEGGSADYGVNLSTTDDEGRVHSIQGVPLSRVAPEFLARFGITDGKGGKAEGQDGDKAKGEGDDKAAGVSPLRSFFPQQGGKSSKAG